MTRRHCAHGLTVIELLAVLIVTVVVAGVLLPLLESPRCRGCRQMKDATQVRGIQQAMAIWASQNEGLFPLPSKVDGENLTVSEAGEAKDTTANILSLLIYTGGISVELCVSPEEANTGAIQQDDDYMFDAPVTAVDPAKALWDPGFVTDFTGGKVGNFSYAHIMPGGTRCPRWRDTFTTTEPVIGNRGPEVASVSYDAAGRVAPKVANPDTNTFLIHGSRNSWEGNIAYNDGHVAFETTLTPEGVTYADAAAKKKPDCLFFDEPDDAAGLNAIMSNWVKAGLTNAAFTGIWD